jgi:AcrR family transcriptional regulator
MGPKAQETAPAGKQAAQAGKRRYRMSARAQAAAATSERLLAAAWGQFATQPYEEVRLRAIAAEAGVTAQTLHARFRSKEELFTAAYAWFGAQELSERPAEPASDLRAAIAPLFDRYERHGRAILRMLSQEEQIPAVRRMTDAGREYHRHWARVTFAPLLLRGLRGRARERRALAIATATDLLVWKILRLDLELPRAEAEATMVAMLGVAPPEAPQSTSVAP